ncbi:MAG TPA: hypothetical protein P5234_15130 [Thermoanaerobaculaceae bacterium]|nr:hypothetical protein [Thermoanaerobaculaceae bacterium]HRS17567.1 hypothetical protein [Thermoanaerobaculaceae bacterium]
MKEDGDSDLGTEILPSILESEDLKAVFLFGDFTESILRTATGDHVFLGTQVTSLGDRVAEMPLASIREERIRRAICWASTIGNMWVLFQFDLRAPAAGRIATRWRFSDSLPPAVARRPGDTERLTLRSQDWAELKKLLEGAPDGTGLLSLADEGIAICIFGADPDLEPIRKMVADGARTSS